jgi:hypothetical protein
MGISGRPVKSFDDANLACCTGINLDAGYRHVFFDVVKHEQHGKVHLKSHWDGSLFEFEIENDRYGEFVRITQKSPYSALWGDKAETFRIEPFKGERF